ncbi:YbbR domain-containing protein [Thermolongibacillus altinsuensis]|uniref:YbbR domain-containing protein n=1 Tax=Thermolongibacillus altinsuensis TaxID=575256 RepID=A0A4R1Q8H0_9BACL|nr:CdaR family protein [Thermolongibacillus altinsuensis]TCL43959.1 YbbR domain-containing protein [Thermolongibacillus altinsuensis]
MDKLMNNPWFIRIFSLLLALMIYMSVNIETQSNSVAKNTVGKTDVETVTEVPVVAYYDQENLVVSGIPKFVNVTLEGPKSILKPTALQRDFEIYVDLSNLELGTHKVPLKYRNISDKLRVKIDPATITVVIDERVSRDFPVEVDFINKNKIADGYSPEQPIVKPNLVKVTGAKNIVERVALVKARIDLRNAEETIERESRVTVYDREGNVLPLEVEPSVVDITVPIKSPSKTVPFKINRKGALKKGLSIVKIEAVPNEVTIFGPKARIDEIEFIDGITINLDEITENTTLEVDVPLPKGVKAVDPGKIKIYIEVEKEEKRTFEDVPIQILGLSDAYTAQFLNPEDGKLTINALGAPSVLHSIQTEDIELYLNVSEFGIGEHEVPIEVNGPQNIQWELPQKRAKIKIAKKE